MTFDQKIAREMLSKAKFNLNIDSYTVSDNKTLIILGGQPGA